MGRAGPVSKLAAFAAAATVRLTDLFRFLLFRLLGRSGDTFLTEQQVVPYCLALLEVFR
jgi:hypothetical protein